MLKVTLLVLAILLPFILAGKWDAIKLDDGSVCNELKKDADYETNKHSRLPETCIQAVAKFSTNSGECRYCPPGLVPSFFNGYCFAITPTFGVDIGFWQYSGSSNVPSGQTECDQLQDLCDFYNGFSFIQGIGENAKCYCFALEIQDCYEENKLYVEGTLPVVMSLEDCFEACKSVTSCEFFTWNSDTHRCGLRSYKPNALIKVPNLRTGTRDGGILTTVDRVYVGDATTTPDREACKRFCEWDSQCKSVTFTAYISQPQDNCVLNYGPVINVINLPPSANVASCEPCPGP